MRTIPSGKREFRKYIFPGIVAISQLPVLYKGRFGLADDHLFYDANSVIPRSFSQIFNFLFHLQPWGDSPRFNPSELLGWNIETYVFGLNPLPWRLIQLFAYLICAVLIYDICGKMAKISKASSEKLPIFQISFQIIFLGLPFWGETIPRIGCPETFAAVTLCYLFNQILGAILDAKFNFLTYSKIFLATILLAGFKENLISISILSIILQIFLTRNLKSRSVIILIIILQALFIVLIVLGFLPTLLNSGVQINGVGIGIERLAIGKWLFVPIISSLLSVVHVAFLDRKDRAQIVFGLLTPGLILVDYFIMGGKLSGHYGFLSFTLIFFQSMWFVLNFKYLKRLMLLGIVTIGCLGMFLNTLSINNYISKTKEFSESIKRISKTVLAQNSKDLILVINNVRYYESVASLDSFLRSSKINLFIDTSELKGSGMLESQLRLASQIGELNWGVR